MFYGQMKWKLSYFSNQQSRWVWREKKNAYTENHLYVSMVEVEVT